MKRKMLGTLTLVLGILCMLTFPAGAEGGGYPDTKEHYAQTAIDAWSGYGVLKGYPDGSFRPDGTITRAELATVLDRVMGYRSKAENTYSDLPDGKWCAESILHLAAQGIFTGDEAGRMNPNAPITRQEAFAALARVLELEESERAPGFADDGAISGWAKGYIAAMREAGYINGDKDGKVRPSDPISRGEVVVTLNRMVPAFINEDGTYSEDCKGNIVVNAQNVTLKDMTVDGDLIVADGTAEGDVYLDKVTVKGDVVLRGCGENSFHIKPGCKVENIIITKTTGGRIRLVNESGETIPMVYIDDGAAGVTLGGGFLGNVVVACDAQVTIASMSVKTLSVAGNAQVTVEKGSTVARAELGATAKGASFTVKGKVTTLVNDAGAAVDNKGTIGSSGGGGSSGSGGSSSGSGGSGSLPGIITRVTLQMLAPKFGEIPDTADVMGVGYTAKTEWKNADGTPATYRWKENSADADTFTANQAYQAIITLTPNSGYGFNDKLQVEVTDGKDQPTSYTPVQVTANGKDRVVKMVYHKTENKDPVSSVNVAAPTAVNLGATAKLEASYWNNLLVDPVTFTYRWYRCSDANGSGKTLIAGAVDKEYTVQAGDTQNAGELYYCCEVIVQGKAYPSSVKKVEVRNAVDPSTLPAPVIGSDLRVRKDGRFAEIEISNLMKHADVSYDIQVQAEVKSVDSGFVYGNSIDTGNNVHEWDIINGTWTLPIDLAGLISAFVPMENDMAYCHDLELGAVTVSVEPKIRQSKVQDKCQEQTFDLTGTGDGQFHIYTYETADDIWQGPSRDLQFVIHDSVYGDPYGTFVDKNVPEHTPVSPERYPYVDMIFGEKTDWMDGMWREHGNMDWEGKVYIWDSWLDGFETGESKAEVRCTFYESNYPNKGMSVYYIKIKGQDIIFDLENS